VRESVCERERERERVCERAKGRGTDPTPHLKHGEGLATCLPGLLRLRTSPSHVPFVAVTPVTSVSLRLGSLVMSASPLILLAPVFLVFEALQLVVAERHLGIKQIEAGLDPRTLGPSERVAKWWSLGILGEGVWLALLAFQDFSRVHAACMLLVTLVGFSLRNNCRLRRVLVILTIEGALRIGLLVSLIGMAWRTL
jgi:hypothetical protein